MRMASPKNWIEEIILEAEVIRDRIDRLAEFGVEANVEARKPYETTPEIISRLEDVRIKLDNQLLDVELAVKANLEQMERDLAGRPVKCFAETREGVRCSNKAKVRLLMSDHRNNRVEMMYCNLHRKRVEQTGKVEILEQL